MVGTFNYTMHNKLETEAEYPHRKDQEDEPCHLKPGHDGIKISNYTVVNAKKED